MPARTRKIRVMIADDHAILRAGLKMLVNAQTDMEVVAEAPDGEQAIQTRRKRDRMWRYWISPCAGRRYEGARKDGARLQRNPGARPHNAR